ncbi:MAG: hypothetical protein ACN4GR_02245 [Arenicellales bacterium]
MKQVYKTTFKKVLLRSMALLMPGHLLYAQTDKWQPVSGAETLRNFVSGLTAERTLPNGEISKAEYRADGTGTLYSWGANLSRTWSVKGDDQICISEKVETLCYTFEKNTVESGLYRAREVISGTLSEFRAGSGRAVVTESPEQAGEQGSAVTASAAEIAAELSNPNTSVATLTFKNQFRRFEGDPANEDDQTSYTLLFQPGLPFVLESGDKILWRPAVPLLIDKPVLTASTGEFEGESGLGDIAFDLAYVPKTQPSLMIAYGFITSLPTATNDLGTGKWTLGPEFLIGKLNPKYVLGFFPNHQWDVGGSGDVDINLTTIQLFGTYLPGDGWSIGSAPIMTYDWNAEQWTVPLQINAGKTIIAKGRPWKLSAELNYYVEKADAFGPEWMLSFNIAPVVKNGMASWFGLGKN